MEREYETRIKSGVCRAHVRLSCSVYMYVYMCVSCSDDGQSTSRVTHVYTFHSLSLIFVQAAREKQTIERLASKTHKDKVNEFNDKLANLTEHHDIPKVGPG